MKHTKGKWDISTELTQGPTNGTRRVKSGFDEICMVNPNIDEHEANALLISKAPEMYEALKDIIDRYPNSPWIIDKLESLLKEIES